MLPLQMAEAPNFDVGDYIYIHGIKAALDNPGTTFKGYVIHEDAPVTEITLLHGKPDGRRARDYQGG